MYEYFFLIYKWLLFLNRMASGSFIQIRVIPAKKKKNGTEVYYYCTLLKMTIFIKLTFKVISCINIYSESTIG